jgi:CubicO group peptidase (beta-lactamase class C family)
MVPKVKVSPDLMSGDVDEGYGKLADVFRRNMTSGQEIGAAVAAYRDGKKVVDLWGGFRNGSTKEPWQEDTMVPVFSTTKGVSSLAVAVAASRGYIDYDAKVVDCWPDFAHAGKESVTVRQLLSHQAGLPALDRPLTLEDLADPAKIAAKIAAQVPAWTPGQRHGYHAITLGWYEGELVRRADPSRRTLGQFFAEEIARPLGLDFHIGLPASMDRSRLAYLHGFSVPKMLLHLHTFPRRFAVSMLNPRTLSARTFMVPGVGSSAEDVNHEAIQAVEMPAWNGIGTARSVAKLYGSVATGGSDLGMTTPTLDALTKPAEPPTDGLRDKVLHIDTTYSLGFVKPFPKWVFGSSEKAFGTAGAGGSFGFADPDTGIGFAYTMNRMGFHIWNDPRELALRNALFDDVLGTRPQT